MSFVVYAAPAATIPGPKVIRAHAGDTLSLECKVKRLRRPPATLGWWRAGSPVTARSRPGVSLETDLRAGAASARLVLVALKQEDAGVYACAADDAEAIVEPAQVQVVVLRGESLLFWFQI